MQSAKGERRAERDERRRVDDGRKSRRDRSLRWALSFRGCANGSGAGMRASYSGDRTARLLDFGGMSVNVIGGRSARPLSAIRALQPFTASPRRHR